jgi:hypothetical protein
MQDMQVFRDIGSGNAAQTDQERTDGNQLFLSDEVLTEQDSQSDAQLAMILRDSNANNAIQLHNHDDKNNDAIPDELGTTMDDGVKIHSEPPVTANVLGIEPVFMKCFVAGLKLSHDPPAPHMEDLTIATIENDVESGHPECWNGVVDTI